MAIVYFPQAKRIRLALAATNLPPSSTEGSAYGVWFYNSSKEAQVLGFPDKVVGADGKLQTVADLSPDMPRYREVLLTRETSQAPRRPGTVVLRARLKVTPGQRTTP